MSGGTRLWGGRFSGGPVEAFDRLNASLATDQRMWAQDIAGSVAHVSMLVSCGILPGEDGESVIRALAQVHQEFATDQFTPAASDEDIHTAVERRVTEIAGDAGARMHTARSRNDQVATDVLLYLREALVGQLAGLRRLVDALLEQARQHVDTLVPGYTHLQRAQPVRLAHHLLAYVWMLARDRARLVQVRDVSLMECPLGAGEIGRAHV